MASPRSAPPPDEPTAAGVRANDGGATVTGANRASGVAAMPREGARLDRYTILESVGAGGMGEVYAAYDGKLDRKVALKVLRVRGAEFETRLTREAQAMARLTHPNVVAVFDTGHVEGNLYLAMEFVRGETLRKWQKAAPRSLAELLRVYTDAGQGLAAAHAAGLVHRDFKPDNVLVAEDGRIKVTDFGIARAVSAEEVASARAAVRLRSSRPPPPNDLSTVPTPTTTPVSFSSGSLDNPVTLAGTLLGTPGYMAPEQLLCETVDARTDQFAFCVSLYEALYGQRPFAPAHSSLEQVVHATLLGRVNDPPRGTTVPSHVRRILVRGLAIDRDARYPSMRELLEDLAKDPAKKRRRIAWATVAGASAAVLVALGAVEYRKAASGRALVCRGSETELAGVWDGARKTQLEKAFLATGSPIAQDTWGRVERAVDAYTKSWVAMRTEACEATRLRGTQSDEVMTLRMACLDRRREGVKAYVDVFANADAEAVSNAVRAASSMAPVDGCADVTTLRMAVRPPEDPVARAKVDALRPKVAEVKALFDAGRYAGALERAAPAIREAEEVHYRPLEAELRFWSAKAHSGAGNLKEAEAEGVRALWAAVAGGHQALAARAAAQLAKDLSALSREAEGLRWAEHGQALVEHLGKSPEIEGELEQALAYVVWRRDPAAALRHDERARELLERSLAPDNPELGIVYNGISIDYYTEGEYQKAFDFDLRALAHFERTVGPAHPYLARTLSSLGGTATELGRYDDAERFFQRCLALPGIGGAPLVRCLIGIAYLDFIHGRYQRALAGAEAAKRESDKSLGEQDPYWLPYVLDAVGAALSSLGRHEEALAATRRAVALREANYDATSDIRAEAYDSMGLSLRAAGQERDSLAFYQRSLQIHISKDHPYAAESYTGIGLAHLAMGHFTEAASALQHAIDIVQTRFDKEHVDLAEMLSGLGRAQLGLGHAEEAIPNLERAIAIGDKAKLAPELLAEARLAMAQATWASGGSHAAARELALAAKEDAEHAEGDQAKLRARIGAWLAAHP